MKQRITIFRWAVCFVLAALFLFAVSVQAHADVTEYDLWVAGTQVTSENAGDLTVINGVDVSAGGQAKYEPAANKLTLVGATVKYPSNSTPDTPQDRDAFGIYYSGEELLTIDAGGTTNVSGAHFESRQSYNHGAIKAYQSDLKIELRDGAVFNAETQKLNAIDYVLYASANLTIKGPESGSAVMNITGKNSYTDYDRSNGICVNGSLYLDGNVTVNSDDPYAGCSIHGSTFGIGGNAVLKAHGKTRGLFVNNSYLSFSVSDNWAGSIEFSSDYMAISGSGYIYNPLETCDMIGYTAQDGEEGGRFILEYGYSLSSTSYPFFDNKKIEIVPKTPGVQNIWVGGTRVTSANQSNVDGNNHVSYDPSTKTLTLDGYSSTEKSFTWISDYFVEKAGIYCDVNGLTIVAKNSNTVSIADTSVDDEEKGYALYLGNYSWYTATITLPDTGDSLTLNGPNQAYASMGLFSWPYLTLNGKGTLTAKGGVGRDICYGLYPRSDELIIDGPTVRVVGGTRIIYGIGEFGIEAYYSNITLQSGTLDVTGGPASEGSNPRGGGGIRIGSGKKLSVNGGKLIVRGGESNTIALEPNNYNEMILSVQAGMVVKGNQTSNDDTALEEIDLATLVPRNIRNYKYITVESPTHKVTVTTEGSGTASASPAEATAGETVKLTATPASGYSFKEWVVTAGGVTVENNSFVMGTEDVAVKAVFAAAAADPTQQMGEDGTPLGKGASLEAADAAITTCNSDEGPAGSVYNGLQAKASKVTKTSIKLTWKKPAGTKKFVIYANKCGKGNKYIKLTETTKASFTAKKVAGAKVKKGTYYKFLIVAVDSSNKVISSSKTIHALAGDGKTGNPTKVTTKAKKNKVTVKVKKTFKLTAKQVGKKVKKHRAIKYESTNPTIATVSSKGVIKGVKKGTCYVFAYAQNGVPAKIKVTVNKEG